MGVVRIAFILIWGLSAGACHRSSPPCAFPQRVCEQCGRVDSVNGQMLHLLSDSGLDRALITATEDCLNADLKLSLSVQGLPLQEAAPVADGAVLGCVRSKREVNASQQRFLQSLVHRALERTDQRTRDSWASCYERELNQGDLPRAYVMDSYEEKYDEGDERNAVLIARHLRGSFGGEADIRPEDLYSTWAEDARIIRDPRLSLLIIHISSFYSTGSTPEQRDERFQQFVRRVLDETKMVRVLAYTRKPSESDPEEKRVRYSRLRSFLCDERWAKRVDLWPVPGGEGASFKDPQTLSMLETRVGFHLRQEDFSREECSGIERASE